MVGWHHWLNGFEFEQIQGDSGGLSAWCAAVHGVKKSLTWLSNWTTGWLWLQIKLYTRSSLMTQDLGANKIYCTLSEDRLNAWNRVSSHITAKIKFVVYFLWFLI